MAFFSRGVGVGVLMVGVDGGGVGVCRHAFRLVVRGVVGAGSLRGAWLTPVVGFSFGLVELSITWRGCFLEPLEYIVDIGSFLFPDWDIYWIYIHG